MMPAATHFDPVLGVDVHIVQPPGPVPPVPIPHPYIGIVFDPADYVPIIGSTIKINGMHRAIAGTAGKALPKHIPIGGVFVPPIPADEHENFMGSATVEMDGDAAAYLALPCLSCQSIGMPPIPRLNPKKKTKIKSLVLPTTVVLPIPKGPPVLIGGPPTISLMSVAMHLVGPLAKAIGRSKKFRKGMKAFRKAKKKAIRNMKPGFLKCNILKAEPVDVVTGEVVVDQQDFELPGRIPIRWTRHYRSGSTRPGVCGIGWETPADARLEPWEDGSIVFHDGTGVATYFDAFPDAEPVMEPVDGGRLHRLDRHYAVELKGGLTYYFDVPPKLVAEIPVTAIMDRCRNSLHFLRDAEGLREVVEGAGRRLLVTSKGGLIERITLHHPDFPERRALVRYGYDAAGNLAAVHDALDRPYAFGWDGRHCLVRHTNRTGLSFNYEYDHDGRCVHSWGDGGLYDYHFNFDPLSRWTNYTDSLGHCWSVELNDHGQVVREIDPLGGLTSHAYDEVGRTTSVTDPGGRTTQYRFDERGNLVELVRPDGLACRADYGNGDLVSKRTDAAGAIWSTRWDERGLLRERTTPRGGVWQYHYGAHGDLITLKDALGAQTEFGHDTFGHLIRVSDPQGRTHRIQRDILGNAIAVTDQQAQTTRYHYDAKGRLVWICTPKDQVTTLTYTPNDELASVINSVGVTTRFEYVGLGQIARRLNADGTNVHYEYDSEEFLIAVINERGERYSFRRDQLGRVVEHCDYWGERLQFAYDTVDNIVACEDARRNRIGYRYDPLDRLVERSLANGHVDKFEYDGNGNLLVAQNANLRVECEYDEDSNLVVERQGEFEIHNVFDLVGNRIARCSTHGNLIEFEFEAFGDIGRISVNGSTLFDVTYDAGGRPAIERLGTKLTRCYGWDANGDLLTQELLSSTGPIISRHYSDDGTGNVVSREEIGPNNAIRRISMCYDACSRATTWSMDGRHPRTYTYDAHGDRAIPTALASDDAHRFAILGDCLYGFDADGNMVLRQDGSGRISFAWDELGRLKLATSETHQEIRFTYDALGRRITKTVDGQTTRFQWDGDRLLAEVAQSGKLAREYIFRPDGYEPIALIEEKTIYFDNDRVGAPLIAFSEDGDVIARFEYDAYGVITIDGNANGIHLRFQGQYHDSETGLSYNRYRYYDPYSGAFVSMDPMRFLSSHNLYRYAPNAWAWFDPLGLIIVYRNIRSDEDPAAGLVAKRPGRNMTPAGHVRNGSNENFRGSQFISTTTDPDVARRRAQKGQRTVRIDTDLLEPDAVGNLRIVDLSSAEKASAAGLRGPARNYAANSREVLLEARVPPHAITPHTFGCG